MKRGLTFISILAFALGLSCGDDSFPPPRRPPQADLTWGPAADTRYQAATMEALVGDWAYCNGAPEDTRCLGGPDPWVRFDESGEVRALHRDRDRVGGDETTCVGDVAGTWALADAERYVLHGLDEGDATRLRLFRYRGLLHFELTSLELSLHDYERPRKLFFGPVTRLDPPLTRRCAPGER